MATNTKLKSPNAKPLTRRIVKEQTNDFFRDSVLYSCRHRLYGAVRTVTAKNPVHAALHLVLTFCVSAMIWMLMQAEFLGVTLVVVYVGAVMVLFLFVVMMLNIDIEEMRAGFWRHALLPVWSAHCWRLP